MTDVTVANPVLTPQEQPARGPDGTLINQATVTPSTPADSSSTPAATPPPDPKIESLKTPDPKDPSLLNAKPEGAPDKYTDFKLPDGLALKPEVLTEAQGIFKGLNLSQDQAQSLVDFHAKQISDALAAPFKTVTELKSTWESAVLAKYGDDIKPGGKVNIAIARVIDGMPKDIGPAFREAMDLTLAGSNPAFVQAMAWIAEKFSEGTSVKGNGPSPLGQKGPDVKPRSVAEALYPHLPSANRSAE